MVNTACLHIRRRCSRPVHRGVQLPRPSNVLRMVAHIRHRHRRRPVDLHLERQIAILNGRHLGRRIEHSARHRQPKLRGRKLTHRKMRPWKRIGRAGKDVVPRVGRIGDGDRKITRLRLVGPLIQQPLWKSIEEPIRTAHHEPVLARDVVGKTNARPEVLPVLAEDGVLHPAIAEELQAHRSVRRHRRLEPRLEAHQRRVQIARRKPRLSPKPKVQRKVARRLQIILNIQRRAILTQIERASIVLTEGRFVPKIEISADPSPIEGHRVVSLFRSHLSRTLIEVHCRSASTARHPPSASGCRPASRCHSHGSTATSHTEPPHTAHAGMPAAPSMATERTTSRRVDRSAVIRLHVKRHAERHTLTCLSNRRSGRRVLFSTHNKAVCGEQADNTGSDLSRP